MIQVRECEIPRQNTPKQQLQYKRGEKKKKKILKLIYWSLPSGMDVGSCQSEGGESASIACIADGTVGVQRHL